MHSPPLDWKISDIRLLKHLKWLSDTRAMFQTRLFVVLFGQHKKWVLALLWEAFLCNNEGDTVGRFHFFKQSIKT
jgi:hypothetical protein